MANIKYISTGNQYIDGYIDAWESDVNISTNKSIAHAAVYLHRNNTWNGNTHTSHFWRKLTINGANVYETTSATTIPPQSSGYVKVAEGSVEVEHGADGKKSITITFVGEDRYSSTTSGFDISSQTGTLKLADIPRQATLLTAPNFNDEENPVITYNNPAGTIATTLQACITSKDGATYYAAYRDIDKTSSNYTFNLTTAERTAIRNATKNSNTLEVVFHIKTVIGGNTLYSALNKTVSIVNAAPTLNPTVKDVGDGLTLTGDANKVIKGINHMEYTTGATALKGATITSYNISCGSKTATTATGSLLDVDSATFVFTVVDSRGNSTTKTINKTLIDYVKLSNNIADNKPNATGNMTVQCSGNYFNGSFGAVSNTLTVQYRYKEQGGTYSSWTAMTTTKSGNTYTAEKALSGLDYQKTYVFQTRAIDKVYWEGVASEEIIVQAYPVFDWSKDDFNFSVDVRMGRDLSVWHNLDVNNQLTIKGKSIFDLVYPVGAVYISFDATNPTYLFGGTWENIQGRFLIAAGTGTDANNITKTFKVEQIGGEYDHTLTIQEMPSHTHELGYNPNLTIAAGGNYGNAGNGTTYGQSWNTRATGGSWSHNNIPPYLAVYMWKRTA